MLRALPFLATSLVGFAHALAWRNAFGVSAWIWICVFSAPVLMLSTVALRRDEVLGTLLRPVAGDAARGIGAGAAGLVLLYGVAVTAFRFFPVFVAKDLFGLVRVAASAPSWARGVA